MILKQIGNYSVGLPVLAFGKAATTLGCATTGGVFGAVALPVHVIRKVTSKNNKSQNFWNSSLKEKFQYLNQKGRKAGAPFNKFGEKMINRDRVTKINDKIDQKFAVASSSIGAAIGSGVAVTVGAVAGITFAGFMGLAIGLGSTPHYGYGHHHHHHYHCKG